MGNKILLVEDNDNNMEIIEGFLKLGINCEHGVIKCKNGKEGWDALVAHHDIIDLILLDKMMPILVLTLVCQYNFGIRAYWVVLLFPPMH